MIGAIASALGALLRIVLRLIPPRRTAREKVLEEQRETEIDARKKMDDAEAKSGDPVDDLRKHGF